MLCIFSGLGFKNPQSQIKNIFNSIRFLIASGCFDFKCITLTWLVFFPDVFLSSVMQQVLYHIPNGKSAEMFSCGTSSQKNVCVECIINMCLVQYAVFAVSLVNTDCFFCLWFFLVAYIKGSVINLLPLVWLCITFLIA